MSSRLKYLVLFVLIAGLQQIAWAQSNTALAKIDSAAIRIGQQTTLRLFVNAQVKQQVSFPVIKDSIGKLQVVRLDKTDTLPDQDRPGMQTIRRNYVITGFEAGSHTIPAIGIKVGADSVFTQPLTLEVTTVKVDTTKAFYDIKQPLVVQYTFWDWLRDNWLWIFIPLVVIALIIGLIIYLKNRPKPAPAMVEAPKPIIPPHVAAAAKLNELRDKKLWQMDFFKEYHSELTDIVREYIELRFGISTFEKTTDEIMDGLRNTRLSDDDRRRLQQLFTLADLVKFAKEQPIAADNEQSMADALAFVESTGKQSNREGGPANGVA